MREYLVKLRETEPRHYKQMDAFFKEENACQKLQDWDGKEKACEWGPVMPNGRLALSSQADGAKPAWVRGRWYMPAFK